MRRCPASLMLAALLLVLFAGGDALAHHPTGGKTPETIWHGFLSGIGHPVIGPDHLAFIVAVGIASAFVPAGAWLAVAFVTISMLGVLAHLQSVPLPKVELLVALTVVIAGLVLATGEKRRAIWLGMAAVAGLIHGYAFGEAVVGAEGGVIGAYLAGLAVIGMTIALAVRAATRSLAKANPHRIEHAGLRHAGLAVSVLGLVLVSLALVPSAS